MRAPHDVRLGNRQSSQEIEIDRMPRMGLGEPGFPIERLYAHLSHEGAHAASADLMALVPQFIPDAPAACVGALHMSSLSLSLAAAGA